MISKASRYGVRAVLYLSVHSSESVLLGVKELAEVLKMSQPTLSKILQLLTKRKFITSKKGRNGGFYMMESQKNDTLMNVLLNFESSERILSDCMLGQKNSSSCKTCPYQEMVQSIRSQLKTIYGTDSIKDTAQKLYYKLK